MPRPEAAERRERQRDKARKYKVSGRGLITDQPNVERRKKKRKHDNRKSQG